MQVMTQHFFILGSNGPLSVAELKRFVEIEEIDEQEDLALGTVRTWPNPRNLYKTPESLLQDQIGGVIRIGEVIGKFKDWDALVEAMLKEVPEEPTTPKFRFAVSAFGPSSHDMRTELLKIFKEKRDHCRFTNPPKGNMSSARIFDERLIQKGLELSVWFRGDHYLLVKTVSNQNIRNYTVRDRKKEFRDAHMGMLPPKLAQMMINIASPSKDAVIWDPFCGSGTVNIEAALMGYESYGSDLDAERVEYSRGNFAQMGEHFRFEPSLATFFASDAGKHPKEMRDNKKSLFVVTEGYLGQNFRGTPNPGQIQESKQTVLKIWQNTLRVWSDLGVQEACFALPNWKIGDREISVFPRVASFIKDSGYKVVPLTSRTDSYIYARPDALVGREIVKIIKI